jgi:uncharacterized protein YbgA (DUF1722 family)
MNITINDALNEFYKLKESYEKTYYDKFISPIVKSKTKSNKEKRVEYSKLPKPECINCKRNVGTLFSVKYNFNEYIKLFTIKCGDIKEPCPLNISFNYADRQTFDFNINIQQKSLNNIKKNIIIEKNNTIFNYINETEALTIFNKLTEELKNVSELLGYAIEKNILKNNNPAKHELLKKKEDEFNRTNLMHFKKLLNDYNNTNRDETLLDAVKYYKNEMIPLLNEIQNLKYEVNIIEYNEDKNIFNLIQKKNSLQSQEIFIEDDDKVNDFIKGTTKKTVSKTLKSRDDNKSNKTRKLKPKLELVEEEETTL